MMIRLLFVGLSLCCLVQCQNEIRDPQEYIQWINDPSNHLVKTRMVNGLKISLQYHPNDYLTYNELREYGSPSQALRDSIRKSYENSVTFLLNIAPDENSSRKGDIMYEGVTSPDAFAKRAMEMNFDISQYITLKTAHHSYHPVLTNLENTYGLSRGRNIILVFSKDKNNMKDLANSNQWDIVYRDELFGLGINHFIFYKKDFDRIPPFNFK